MSAGKNPYHRYQVIDACLSNKQKRYWTKQELIDKLLSYDFAVSPRTLALDIEHMRYDKRLGFNAPIQFCKKERAYYYTDPNYSINALQLSDEQLRAFAVIVKLLQQYKGSKVVHEFEGAIEKIVRLADQARRQEITPGDDVIEFEKAPYYKGMIWLDLFVEAIHTKQSVRIAYQKFTAQQPEDHVFHPYLLKEYKGRWYVLGHSDARNNIITLALDRMENVLPEPIPYRENTSLEAGGYFRHTIGITHAKGPVEEIILWFSAAQGHYLKTQHLHSSQKILRDDEGGLVIRLMLIINYELVSVLLSYCPDVSVISPASLRDKVDELMNRGRIVNREKAKISLGC